MFQYCTDFSSMESAYATHLACKLYPMGYNLKMEIIFFSKQQNGRYPVKEFIEKLDTKDRAKVLACLKSVEELGFHCPRVDFRQIRGQLWELKIKAANGNYRIFYVCLKGEALVLLHSYQKQSQKAPKKEIETAEERMLEVLKNEQDYFK